MDQTDEEASCPREKEGRKEGGRERSQHPKTQGPTLLPPSLPFPPSIDQLMGPAACLGCPGCSGGLGELGVELLDVDERDGVPVHVRHGAHVLPALARHVLQQLRARRRQRVYLLVLVSGGGVCGLVSEKDGLRSMA